MTARGHVPTRTCAGCRKRRPARELIRFRVDEAGELTGGPAGERLPGRGAWLCADPACAETAARRRSFGRTLRVPGLAVSPEDARRLLRRAVEERVVQALRRVVRSLGAEAAPAESLERVLASDGWENEALRTIEKGLVDETRGANAPDRGEMTSPVGSGSLPGRLKELEVFDNKEAALRGVGVRPRTPG